MSESPITCHVLDASTGKPADNVQVDLFVDSPAGFQLIKTGETNANGRCVDLMLSRGSEAATGLAMGQTYKIVFKTKQYFERSKRKTFYPWVEIFFTIENPAEHYHIPLLISPYSFTTYRGS